VELKQSRERILRQNEELARVNRRLAESEESLQELNTMKDKFFSLMAHDIRNPLSALHQIAEILVDPSFSLDDAQRKEMFEMLFRAANSLHDLLENILTWGRSQMGRLVVVQKIGAVAPQAEMVAALMAAAFRQKEVRLLQEIGEGVTAFFDANLLSALLRNLVSNALKFTPSGGTVRITAREAGDFVEIAVIDTGEGLKPDDVAKLFRIDVDPHTIGSGKEKGTGLGLILCREFVEKQGGRIRVESELEKGSTFSFTVPRSGVDPAKEPPASSSPGRA